MTAMTCAELREVSSELALDLLGGVERARALAHLDVCDSCRHEVAALADVAQDLLLLTPPVDPPAGFADRVVERVERLAAADQQSGATRRARSHMPRLLAVAAAVLVVLAFALVPVLLDGGTSPARAAAMRTGTGAVVGEARIVGDDPASLVVQVPRWDDLVTSYGETTDGSYWLAVERDDGTRALEAIASNPAAHWRFTVDGPAGDIATVSVVDARGRVWCTARFPT